MLTMQTRLDCPHSFATDDCPDLLCDYDGKCDGELYECCLFDKSHGEQMALIQEHHLYFKEDEKEQSCTSCILDGTDACTRGAGRAVDDSICKDFITEKEDKHERQQANQ